MQIEQKIRTILRVTGWTQQELARHLAVSQSTVNRWLTGSEPEGANRDAINQLLESRSGMAEEASAYTAETAVPLMGYVGAGAEVEPDFEQVPPEGLDQITVPFPLPADMIALQVKGDSMLPQFRDGSVIIAYREQKRPVEAFYGEEAAVRTVEGRRYIKTIIRGQNGVNLISWNASPIENVQLVWIGEIFTVFPASSIRRVGRQGGIQGQLRYRT